MELKWSITSLHAKNDQSLGDVVVQVRWKVIGTDSNGISGYFDGATPLKVENINHSEFINFDQLTEDTVIEWVKLSISDLLYTRIIELIQKQIDSQLAPVMDKPLPWLQQPSN